MSRYQLAQLNIATLKAPLDDPIMAEFVANLDRINTLADQSPGFVWRLQSDQGDATELRPFGDEILVNLSVWQDTDALRQYVYRSAHTDIMRRRKQWFERMTEAYDDRGLYSAVVGADRSSSRPGRSENPIGITQAARTDPGGIQFPASVPGP